ncbi:transposase [Ghiorsea bivora]|uniref:transposase n=1 Tax=Ghiorsea bivora TaxID=1485545 RepID=UPI00056DB0F3|nr:transposase [Ghiorsea bivora]
MARPLRIEYEGAVYHVTSRGNAQTDIYLSDADRDIFLDVLTHVVERFDWVCHAYCLMSNHYHLMIETPKANLSRGMRQLNGMYTQRFNRAHHRIGHVFQGRFKSIIVDKDAYLLELSRYIVRNPVAANMVNSVSDWPWSSYNATAGIEKKPAFLTVNWLLSQFGGDREAYKRFVNQSEVVIPWKSLNGPDLLGDDAFRQRLQAFKSEPDQNIPKRKQTLRHLPLAELAAQEKTRGEWMRKAYQEHGYTMQSIADFAGLHHSTVSRLIKQQDENARNKT